MRKKVFLSLASRGFFLVLLLALMAAGGCFQERPSVKPMQRAKNALRLEGWQIDTVFKGNPSRGYRLAVVDAQVVYAVSVNYGDIYKTTNGGLTWHKQSSPVEQHRQMSLASPQFVDSLHGFIAVQDNKGCPANCQLKAYLLVTTTGGQQWQLQETNLTRSFFQMHFSSLTEGVGLSLDGLFRTGDGGNSWQAVAGITRSTTVKSMQFLDATKGFLRGSGQQLYRTLDGGKTWEGYEMNFPGYFYEFQFVSPVLGYAAGSGFYQTTDGGRQWKKLLEGGSDLVGFPSPQEGLVIRTIRAYPNDHPDADRELLFTLDGGSSWIRSLPVYNLDLEQAIFPTAQVGYSANGPFIVKLQRK